MPEINSGGSLLFFFHKSSLHVLFLMLDAIIVYIL